MVVEALAEDRRSRARKALLKAVAERYDDRFDQLPLEVIIGIGHKT
jgi:hypothetical protein